MKDKMTFTETICKMASSTRRYGRNLIPHYTYYTNRDLHTIYKDIPNEAFFFASLNYTPLNIKFLDNFFLKYNRIYKVLESSFTDRAIEETEKATVEAVEASNAARNERGKTLQLVGLFGCFIAFVSSVVGTHRVATGIYEFIVFI